jgi:hypothetical protein
MVCFQAKNPNLGKFWRALDWKLLMYLMAIWNILHTFRIFCDNLVHFVFFRFWYYALWKIWQPCMWAHGQMRMHVEFSNIFKENINKPIKDVIIYKLKYQRCLLKSGWGEAPYIHKTNSHICLPHVLFHLCGQMSLWKIRPNCSPVHFCLYWCINLTVE